MSPPVIICQVCDASLSRISTGEGVTFAHPISQVADHEPVPVQAGPDWRGRCDFCTVRQADFTLPVRLFSLPSNRNLMSIDNWGACDRCALLIGADRWNHLAMRVATLLEKRGIPADLERLTVLAELFTMVRANITGPLSPVGETP
ncbi:hypothetical protein [Actinokineospora sp.]|uniref:hypothetical protein n=1 Tax=Actinokineospora sp. TaxID=1872133 RepID=UPI003D6AF55A